MPITFPILVAIAEPDGTLLERFVVDVDRGVDGSAVHTIERAAAELRDYIERKYNCADPE
jgi:hypothetical protein